MMPVYRYMDSNPYQNDQTFPFPQYQYPGYRATSPMTFGPQPWPYAGNYGYPMPFHSCCNHNDGPGYTGFRPFDPHASMPSPVHFCRGYPAPYHETYPVYYVPPAPHDSMDIPKYEFDKKMPRGFHCCGCPNHTCHQNVDKGMKIEEQGPDVVEKKVDDSLGPVHMKNYPYPIVWFPPESMSGKEQRKHSEPEIIEEKRVPSDLKPLENLKSQEGDGRHGRFPFDMNNMGSLVQGGNNEQVRDQQMEDRKNEFPFPIFRMPSFEEAGKKGKHVNASHNQQSEDQKKQFPFPIFWLPQENKKKEEVGKEDNREVNASPKFVPLKIAEGGDVTGKTGANEEKPVGEAVVERKEKTAHQKSIPVKQMAPHKEGNSKVAPMKHVEDNVADKPSGTSVKRQSSSPKKSSELPPVCLRVDPLPRKKKGNGSSGSPSPPGEKGLKQESSFDTTKASTSAGLQENAQQGSKSQNCISSNSKVEPSKKVKNIEVVDGTISENKDSLDTSQIPVSSKEEVSRKTTVGESEKDGDRCQINEDQGARKVFDDTKADNVKLMEIAKSVGDRNKLQKKLLSDVEAAVLIQSFYRGFEVRRWEPLKKLKQLAEVREQVADVKNRIRLLETSHLQKDDKQRVVIGETIMRLLLKLDTIQGLLPSLRDIRKSLARELVVLQEKLDDLMAKKSQDTAQEASTVKPLEELVANSNNNNCMLEQKKDEVAGLGGGPAGGTSDSSHHTMEPCQDQVLHPIDSAPGLRSEEPDVSGHGGLHEVSVDGDQELPVPSGVKSEDLGSAPVIELKDASNAEYNAGDMAVANTEMGNGSTELEQCGETPFVEDKTEHSVVGTYSEVDDTNPEIKEFEESPRGAPDHKPATSEPDKNEQVEISKNEVKQSGEVELKMPPDLTSPNTCGNVTDEKAEIPEPAELPRDIIDDERAVIEFKKTEEAGVKENDVLESEEEERQMALDGTPNVNQFEQQPERAMEEQLIAQTDEQVKVGSQKDEELPGDSVLKVEVELPPQNEVGKDDFLSLATESIESQLLSLPVQTDTLDVVHEDGPSDILGDATCSSVLADPRWPIEDEVMIERSTEVSEYQPAANTEEDKIMQVQEGEVECKDNKDEPASVTGDAKEDVFVETQSTLVQKSESLPEKPVEGCFMGAESDSKLLEENTKLREMMQKLMAAGNEQLKVISGLTGRVKDLEKKLARKKRVRTRRHRAPSSGSVCAKPSNNPPEEKSVGGAI